MKDKIKQEECEGHIIKKVIQNNKAKNKVDRNQHIKNWFLGRLSK